MFRSAPIPTRLLEFRRASIDPVKGWTEFDGPAGQTLYVAPTVELTNAHIARAEAQRDPDSGDPLVAVTFTDRGAYNMTRLSTDLRQPPGTDGPSRLAILVDGKVLWAPEVREIISSHVLIRGPLSAEEAAALAKGIVGE